MEISDYYIYYYQIRNDFKTRTYMNFASFVWLRLQISRRKREIVL